MVHAVWTSAFNELVSARRWIFIGTSLPETDRFLHYLFGLALQRNTDLDNIVIINQSECGYDKLFKEHAARIVIKALRETFEGMVVQGSRLMNALGYLAFERSHPYW